MIAPQTSRPSQSQRAAWRSLWALLLSPVPDRNDETDGNPASVAADRGTDHQGAVNNGQQHFTKS